MSILKHMPDGRGKVLQKVHFHLLKQKPDRSWKVLLIFCKNCDCAGRQVFSGVHLVDALLVKLTPVTQFYFEQSCRMSIFLHGAKSSSQILPEGKRLNCDHFGTKIEQN